jgi:Protein of unknown function (DUF559)
MGNTEGTPQPGDTVETTREASTREAAGPTHGSNCPYCGVLAASSTEALLNKAFRKLSISFSTQQSVFTDPSWQTGQRGPTGPAPGALYRVDILITQAPVVVEADELYHEIQRDQRELDARKDAELRRLGYQVFRFNEQQIGANADACAWAVVNEARLIPEDDPVFVIRKAMSGPDSATWTGGKPGWDCVTCGTHFHSYKRPGGKPCTTCSRECQRIWQMESGASTRNRRSNGAKMRELWNDPVWRAQQTSAIATARWGER